MGRRVGIQKELNEIAEALTVNGFEVTNMLDNEKKLDAIIYFNDESNLLSLGDTMDAKLQMNDKDIVKINAAKSSIDEIMKILNRLE